jgi:hypothetical protein
VAADETFHRIWIEVELRLRREYFRFLPGTEDELQMLLRSAASRIESEGRTEARDIETVVNRTVRLVRKAQSEADSEYGGIIPPAALFDALGILCPGFWPFC